MNKQPKILLFDVETTPNLAYVWGKYQQDVIEYAQEWGLLCFGWKWLDKKQINSASQRDYSEKELVQVLWNLFNEADIVVAHNGDRFDIRRANAKFVEYGLVPPEGYLTIDTVKVARKYFGFNSNKLNDIAQLLDIGKKEPTGGFALWLGCMRDEPKAWDKMLKYCKQDVLLLEKVYLRLRPWMTNHPNHNVFTGHSHNCPVCGEGETQKRGTYVTRVGKRQRYQCTDCGAWSVGEIIRTKVVTR